MEDTWGANMIPIPQEFKDGWIKDFHSSINKERLKD